LDDGCLGGDFVYLSCVLGGLAFVAARFQWLFIAVKFADSTEFRR
jgi:threonine/homoserine/homoserine lactone efflux protein